MDKKTKQITEVIEQNGFLFQRNRCGEIVGQPYVAQYGPTGLGLMVRIGQKVFANGRIHFPKGTMGLVVKIYLPFTDGKTTDILRVWFEGNDKPTSMKFKDLEGLPTGSLST